MVRGPLVGPSAVVLAATALTAIHYGLRWVYDAPDNEVLCQRPEFRRGHLPLVRWSQDSERYCAMGRGAIGEFPFHLRVLLPLILRDRIWAWHAVTAAALIGTGPLLACYLLGLGYAPMQALLGVALYVGCWGVFGFSVRVPVTVDPVALAWALGLAVLLRADLVPPFTIVILALTGGLIKESTPVFACLFSWDPLPLTGLVLPLVLWLCQPPDPPGHPALRHPIRTAREYRHQGVFSFWMIAPWGVVLPLALLNPSAGLWVTLAVAYSQCFAATDLSRLYQMAFPVVIAHALAVIPMGYGWVILLVHWFHPWQAPPLERVTFTIHYQTDPSAPQS